MRKILFITLVLLCAQVSAINAAPIDEFRIVINIVDDYEFSFQANSSNLIINYEEVGNESVNYGSFSVGFTIPGIENSITLPISGTYRLKIDPTESSNFSYFSHIEGKIIDIEQWGSTSWSSFNSSFSNNTAMDMSATDIPDLSACTTMYSMFFNCQNLVANPSINDWDVSNVTNMIWTFSNCLLFNQTLNNWDVSNVTNMYGLFINCINFNQSIEEWNTSNVTNMSSMFSGCTTFDQPLENWDVSNVTNFRGMFFDCTVFNQPLDNWNTSNALDMADMFNGSTNFNQPLNNWTVTNVTDFRNMFLDCHNFNQVLNNWVIASALDIDEIFSNSGLDCINYSTTLQSWSSDPLTPTGLILHSNGLFYEDEGFIARNTLIEDLGWTISNDIYDPECMGTPLNSSFVKLSVNSKNNMVYLMWNTNLEESAIKSYRIEASSDFTHFQDIVTFKTENGKIISQYALIQELPTVMYRIIAESENGQSIISNPVKVENHTHSSPILFPNPVQSGSYVNINVRENTNAYVYNVMGQQLLKVSLESGMNTFSTDDFKIGTYIIHVDGSSFQLIIQ